MQIFNEILDKHLCTTPKLIRIHLDDKGNKISGTIDTGYGYKIFTLNFILDYMHAGNVLLNANIKGGYLQITSSAPNFIDLSNKYVNSWYIIEYLGQSYWRCQCKCGTIKAVAGRTVTSGKSTNCGCKRDRPSNFIDLTGKTFGLWEVQSYAGDRMWNCICECGEQRAVNTQSLTEGKSTNCGAAIHKSTFIDLTKQQIGDWTVLYYAGKKKWHCRCSCGTERDITSAALRSLLSLSCGHVEDLSKQVFGEWTVIDYAGGSKWNCKCSCGVIKKIKTQALKNGSSTSCGHIEDLTGKEFGQWTVLSYAGNEMWTCQCSCGNISDAQAGNLKSFQSLSCGCCNLTKRKSWQREATRNKEKFNSILANACLFLNSKLTIKEVAYIFDIDMRYVYNLKQKYDSDIYFEKIESLTSEQEDSLYDFLLTLNCTEIIRHNREILKGKELAFYIKDKQLAIEYNGVYWHSSFKKDKNYHLSKTLECKKNNIELIHIFEYEWQNSRIRTILENILKSRLDIQQIKIYARNTELRTISTSEYTSFLSQNHLQGSTFCDIALGLYYNNELIQVMTFGKPRFNAEYDTELLRLCTKMGYKIIGGANKLFKHYIKEHQTESIVSYCDLSKFTGKVYEQIGMKFDGLTTVNYVYVNLDDLSVLSRYQCQKHKLIEQGYGTESQTEEEIMFNRNYVKIYNCGNARYIYKLGVK